MRAFGLIGVVIAALVALAAGVIGFNIGVGTNVVASGATVAGPYWGFGFGFFHPLIGLIFFFLFIALIFALIRRAVWGGGRGRYGHRGYGGWYGSRDEMLQRWHQQAHGSAQPGSVNQPDAQPPAPDQPLS